MNRTYLLCKLNLKCFEKSDSYEFVWTPFLSDYLINPPIMSYTIHLQKYLQRAHYSL